MSTMNSTAMWSLSEWCCHSVRMRGLRAGVWAMVFTSAFHEPVDVRLRFVEGGFRFLRAGKNVVYRIAHRLADLRPLRHARAPVEVRVVFGRFERGLEEVLAVGLHEHLVFGPAPDR